MPRVRGQGIAALLILLCASASPARAQWLPDGAVVCDSTGSQSGVTVIPDGSGGTVLAWQDDRYVDSIDVFVQRLTNAGNPMWKAGGVSLGANVVGGYTFTTHSMISDGNGGFIIGWEDSRAVPNSVVHLQRFTLNGQVDSHWPAGGVALADSGFGAGPPSLIGDGAGGAIAVWEDTRDTSDTVAEDIYAQRVDGNGNILWTPNGVALCKEHGVQYAPQAVGDGLGGAWVTWSDQDTERVAIQHVSAAGAIQFDSTGVLLSDTTAALYRLGSSIVSDGAGGAVVAWYEARLPGNNPNIYVRRVNSAGAPQWAAGGVVICNDPTPQDRPVIVPGGASDYVVIWVDSRAGGGVTDLYAQKVTSAGTVSWAANGVRVGRHTLDSMPSVVSDGSGGAYLGWDDNEGGICFTGTEALTYAQHVVSSGAIASGWPADGRSMSALAGGRYSPNVANDGTGSVVVAWHDARNADCDIYAQRIGGGGEPVSVDRLAVGRGISLAAPEPNPARGPARFDFRLGQDGLVRMQVVNAAGRLVREVVSAPFTAGPHSVSWDGLDSHGVRAGAGFYLVRLEAGGEHVTRPLVFLP